MEEDLNVELPSLEDIKDQIDQIRLGDEGTPTDVPVESTQTEQPSTEGYIAPGEEGFVPREGALGAVQDIAE